MEVTLTKAVRLAGHPLRKQGATFDATPDEVKTLERLGAISTAVLGEKKPENKVTVTKGRDTTVPSENVTSDEISRPAKSASAAKWAEYLTAKGIDAKGLSKREMIAAAK